MNTILAGNHSKTQLVAFATLSLSLCATAARADAVRVTGGEEFKQVKALDVADGKLVFETATGRRMEQPLADITFVQVDDVPSLVNLERMMSSRRYREAADGYERLRDRVGATWQKRLVESRLIRAYDADGRLDKAVAVFAELAVNAGVGVGDLAPSNLPSPGSKFFADALGEIERAAVSPYVDDDTRDMLNAYAERLRLADAGTTPSAQLAGDEGGVDAPPSAASQQQNSALSETRRAFAEERYRQVERLADIARRDASRDEKTELEYLVAASEYRMARGRTDRLTAGLALMRVVARDEESPYAAAALYDVGMLYESLGRQAKARQLYEEARQHPVASESVRQAALEAVARLN